MTKEPKDQAAVERGQKRWAGMTQQERSEALKPISDAYRDSLDHDQRQAIGQRLAAARAAKKALRLAVTTKLVAPDNKPAEAKTVSQDDSLPSENKEPATRFEQ